MIHDAPVKLAVASRAQSDNGGGPEGVGSTTRSLTHSLDYTEEGLTMEVTHHCAPHTCGAAESFRYEVAESGCWIWAGYIAENGYARIYDRANRQIVWAHRYSYTIHKGAIAPRYEIDHVCQETRCVNPAHLDMVTKTEHARRTMQRLGKDDLHGVAAAYRRDGLTFGEIADLLGYAGRVSAQGAVKAAIRKGLIDPDEVPPVRRLTDEDRADIRSMYALGVPQTVIAEFYRVDSSQISRICNGKTSGHSAHPGTRAA